MEGHEGANHAAMGGGGPGQQLEQQMQRPCVGGAWPSQERARRPVWLEQRGKENNLYETV